MVHYDVIIYDQLESPVLWVEENPDSSGQGKSLAIPVEYVHAVFEVKSAFNKQSAKEAVKRYLEETAAILKAQGFVGLEPSDL